MSGLVDLVIDVSGWFGWSGWLVLSGRSGESGWFLFGLIFVGLAGGFFPRPFAL